MIRARHPIVRREISIFPTKLVLSLVLSACGGGVGGTTGAAIPPSDPAQLSFAPELGVNLTEFNRTETGLYIQDVEIGNGQFARRTSRVWIMYVGWLPDGTVIDGNIGGDPYHVRLGGNEVIRGWNEGIVGMKRGGIRRLVVPPGLAYGSRGRGGVPPGSTMIFYVELVDVD